MMLGVWFVFAKQYSDAISENVKRGVTETLNRGKSMGAHKYGYRRRADGYYEPEPEMFDLIRKAFEMKIYDKKSDATIVEWLNNNGRKREWGDRELDATIGKINNIRKDPFYYGILISGEQVVDQRELNPHYQPMITADEFQLLEERRDEKKTSETIQKIREDHNELSIVPRDFLISEDGYALTLNLPNKQRFTKKLNLLKEKNPNATLVDVVKQRQIRYSLRQRLSKLN